MPTPASNRPLELSQKLYQRLLAAYPRPHREEYGEPMAQLFRDQCRDAWAERRALGLAALWLRTLPDLVKTSFLERFATLNPGKFMSDKLNTFLRPRRSPLFTFLFVFTVVFLIVFSLGVVITFLLPDSYASTVRINVETAEENYHPTGQPNDTSYDPYFIQTTFEVIQSQLVLSNVVSQLNLNVAWGKKYYGGETLKTSQTIEILKRRLTLQPVRNTKLIAITVYSEEKNEAAQIANAVAESYQEYRVNQRRQLTAAGLRALEQQYAESEAQIQATQTNLDYLRSQLKINDNDPAALNPHPALTEQMQQAYDQQIVEGQKTFKQLQTQLDELKAMDGRKLRNVLPTVTGDSMLSDLLGKLMNVQQQLSTLTNNYGPDNSKVTTCEAMLGTLNAQIDERVNGIMAGLGSEVSAKQAAVDALKAAVEQARTGDAQAQVREQPYWDEKRNLTRLLDFHKVLAAKLEEEKLDLEIPKDALVQITDTAMPGNAPVKPNRSLNIVLSAILGIMLGALCGSIAAFIAARRNKPQTAPAAGPAV